jgi:ankyrin repeat protein
MSDAQPLAPRPNLEQYKNLARDFQRACKSTDASAIRAWAVRWLETIARLHAVEITGDVRGQINREAQRIEHRWLKFRKKHDRGARCLLADAQFFVALEHGFTSWPKFAAHVHTLTRANSPVSNFEAAADAIVSGDTARLKTLLREHPELVRARSTREHRSALLHYVSANGIEDFRQKTPNNIVEITRILLDAGADVNAASDAYGGGSTTLGLAATSVHPEQAGVQIELLQTLLEYGANIEHPGLAGNQHSAIRGCLANGQGRAARFFASLGVPMTLEEAAGVGRLDAVRSYFDESGALKPAGTQEQMESGFLYACGYGRTEVVEFLLDRGIDPDWRNNEGQTGLHWATYGQHVEVVRLLLQRGARVDVREGAFDGTPLDWALHGWSGMSHATERERAYEVVALLARAGASLDMQWFGENESRQLAAERMRSDPRMVAALRGDMLEEDLA